MIRQQVNDILAMPPELSWGLAERQNDSIDLLRHCANRFIVLRTNWVIDLKQPTFISGSIGMHICDNLPPVAPGT